MSPEIANFTPSVFWDVDRETLDLQANKSFIINRVLGRGQMNDWMLLKAYYTIEGIVDIAKKLRTLDPRTLAFVACLGHEKKEAFRCYTYTQSTPIPWVF
jgi:hypothetical protein